MVCRCCPANAHDPLRTGEGLEPIFALALPHNGREELPPPAEDDGSGRIWPLPKTVMAIMQGDQCVKLTADHAEVPGGAILTLWKRIQAFNELASMSQPATRSNGVDPVVELRRRAEAEAATARNGNGSDANADYESAEDEE